MDATNERVAKLNEDIKVMEADAENKRKDTKDLLDFVASEKEEANKIADVRPQTAPPSSSSARTASKLRPSSPRTSPRCRSPMRPPTSSRSSTATI